MTSDRTVATNLAGVVDTPKMDATPYRVDRQGRPYVPVGDGGIVRGLHLGDSVFATDTDHAAPGACLSHPVPDACRALTSFSCLGNPVTVRGGPASGSRGVVLGKRGEAGRVIVCFPDDVLAQLAPGDAVVVRGFGQGATLPPSNSESSVHLMNISPAALCLLPIDTTGKRVDVAVRSAIPSYAMGNGIGRPAQQWDIDIQVDEHAAFDRGLANARLGDLVAIADLDVRYNAGYRRGWVTVGVVVHAASPQPGHGPGVMPILCGPDDALALAPDPDGHRGLTFEALMGHHEP